MAAFAPNSLDIGSFSFLEKHLLLKQALSSYCMAFGLDTIRYLKEKQMETLIKVMEGKDVLSILPTGEGKSLIFDMIPFVRQQFDKENRYFVIICLPLDALISENRDKYGDRCILIDEHFHQHIPQAFKDGQFDYIICHPENILRKKNAHALHKCKESWTEMNFQLASIIVDEAHCVAQWGDEFRPAFQELGHLRVLFDKSTIVALTATASPEIKKTIFEKLMMTNVAEVTKSVDRHNVSLVFKRRKPQSGIEGAAEHSIVNIVDPLLLELKDSANYPKTVIFTRLKWCGFINDHALRPDKVGKPALAVIGQYHASCSKDRKRFILEEFRSGQLKLVLATEAFRMGIDIPDIRRIIHITPPNTIETYFQQVGRAGRDGLPAHAVCYFNAADIGKHVKHLTDSMRMLCQTQSCRRELILKHFNSSESDNILHKCCDNCIRACPCEDCEEDVISQVELPILSSRPKHTNIPLSNAIAGYLQMELDYIPLNYEETVEIAHTLAAQGAVTKTVEDINPICDM